MTGSEYTNFVLKRVLNAVDFKERFLDYLKSDFRYLGARVYDVDGVFDEKMVVGGTSANTITITQAGINVFDATDGQGQILSLGTPGNEVAGNGQIKALPIENTLAVPYYVSLVAADIPSGIQINPRTGFPEYAKLIEAIGVSADPNSVVDNGGNLTLVIDSACEASHSHAGRTALVWKKTPAQGATLESVAIEACTVVWTGSVNQITTVATFGQPAPSVVAADYTVVLLGPAVRKVDTSAVAGHCYLAVVTGAGAGNTPPAGNNANQQLIDQSLATLTNYPGGPAWLDGETNPATTIVAQITKIITDLIDVDGAKRLGANPVPAWHDGSFITPTDIQNAIDTIVSTLALQTGLGGGDRVGVGAQTKIGALFTESVVAGSIFDQIGELLTSLTLKARLAGSNVFTGANVFNTNTTRLGEDLLDSAAEFETPRLLVQNSRNNFAGTRVLLLRVPDLLAGAELETRIYLTNDSIGGGIEIAVNAQYNETTAQWSCVDTGQNATLYVFNRFEMARRHRSATAGTWSDTDLAWTNQWFKLSSGVSNGGHVRIGGASDAAALVRLGEITTSGIGRGQLRDGRVQFNASSTNTTGSNPPATTAPVANGLYAKNIPKAWGWFSRTGGVTTVEGFNCTITLDTAASPDEVDVLFGVAMDNAQYAILAQDQTSAELSWVVLNKVAGGFSLREIIEASGNDTADLAAGVHEVGFVVYGRQTS